MTTGQHEKIVYRTVARAGRSGSFLPPHGVGYGLGEGLGLVLNLVVKGASNFRTTHRTAVGVVVAEDSEHVIVERNDGRRLRIPISDIIERVVLSQ
ncbi:hypothetical protein E6H27_02805 [Candidatus Bathyarchaeota archaeon]|nr:MAG: hypothetical protein E6H27_02805 [Candidatus Bathyarchaeota archaeon]TMI59746.1 MAG: hypothetical protein E6H14_02485 [Candidatus Bathyarchaeota archaeon]